jgi:WD40 repeat protein
MNEVPKAFTMSRRRIRIGRIVLLYALLLGVLAGKSASADGMESITPVAASKPVVASNAEPASGPPPQVAAAIEILRDECISCHKGGKPKGGLKLTTLEGLKAGGNSGAAILPGKPEESPLYTLLSKGEDPHMPPKKQLSETQMAAIKIWIESGAHWDSTVMDAPPRVGPVVLRPMPKGVLPVLALAFSPDGKTLAVGRGGRVELRDAAQPKMPVRSAFDAQVENISSIAWAPDGETFATGGFRKVRFWGVTDGAAKGGVESGLVGDVNVMAWAKTGEVLWVGDSLPSRAGFVHRLSWPALQWGHTWKAHEDAVYGMALSVDGKWLATAGADRFARRWDAATDSLASVYEGHTNHVLSVVFDPVSPRIATAGADRELKVWDRDSREQDAVLGDKKQVFTALNWAKDGSVLVAVTDRGYGACYSAIQKHTGAQRSDTSKVQALEKVDAVLQCVAVAPDAKSAVAGAADGRLFVWSLPDGKLQPLD